MRKEVKERQESRKPIYYVALIKLHYNVCLQKCHNNYPIALNLSSARQSSWEPKTLFNVGVTKRTSLTWTMTKFTYVLKNHNMNKHRKIRLVRPPILPIFLYASTCWLMNEIGKRRISVFEMISWKRLLIIPLIVRRRNKSIPTIWLWKCRENRSTGKTNTHWVKFR